MSETEHQKIRVSLQLVGQGTQESIPRYQTELSSGVDLHASESMVLLVGKRALVPTGISISLPAGTEAQIRPRSGLAYRNGITCLNTPGTIDADYRGEIKVLLINLGDEDFQIKKGDRIAQLVVAPVYQVEWEVCAQLNESERGDGGFGHTGVTSP
ncbi:MAG: dUTP diphosphatase [Planctomycetes bacterium]|nr:dUTP diphosphatase [Planctomycetota bacterium]